MKRNAVTVKQFCRCEHCEGSGKRKLTTIERDTLASVDDTWTSTNEVMANLGVTIQPTALIQRLHRLRLLGLVEVNREQYPLLWRAS